MKNQLPLFFIASLIWAGCVRADDIEIVIKDNGATGLPYVHVVLDTSATADKALCTYGPAGSCAPPFMTPAAYSNLVPGHSAGDDISRIEVFSAVLGALFQDSRFSQLNVSLLLPEGDDSGSVLSPYRQLGADYQGQSGAQILKAVLNEFLLNPGGESSSSFQAKGAFYQWYHSVNESPTAGAAFPDSEACSKLFSIVMATESTTENGVLDPDILAELGMPVSSSGGFTALLKIMHGSSTDLVKGGLAGINALERTWVAAPSPGVGLAWDWAQAGGTGKPLNLDAPALLQGSLERAFLQARSISRTAVASGVPMTALGTAGPSAHSLFLPLYKPEATLAWAGNIKKFKISPSQSGEPGQIIDVKGSQALVSTGGEKGQVAFDALSYWTDTGLLPPATSADIPFGVDGRVVARGGAGQKIPGLYPAGGFIVGDGNGEFAARQLFIEPSGIVNGGVNSLVPLNVDGSEPGSTAALIKPLLQASSPKEAEQLIRWARGQDVDDEDGDGDVLEARSWLMGSAIHSRPVALNYGAVGGFSTLNPNIRIFAGTGGGVFHAIENTTPGGEESGREVFGFYPNEGLANIALLRDNTLSSLAMRYGVDGAPAIFTLDNNHDGNLDYSHPENDEAYVYFGLRRGGYSYYALDVSNPADAPSLRWKISRGSGADFAEMGLGFSKPVIGKVKFGGESLDVLIIAGGYHGGWDASYTHRVGKDTNADDDVKAGGSVSTGNALYIVDARTGELVWKAVYGQTTSTATSSTNTLFQHAELVDSIPSSVSALKNASGTIERLYVGDTGGAIWRVDLPVGNDPANENHRKERWFISKLAELGTDGATSDRRFFHAPDLLRSMENDATAFDGLLISSGNRASPNSIGVSNYHFYLKDALIISGDDAARARAPITAEGGSETFSLADRSKCLSGGAGDSHASCSLPMAYGWMIKMEKAGEKGLSSPVVDGGRVIFSSYVPAQPEACAATPGEGYLYLVNLLDASSVEPGVRIHWLGKGIPQATLTLGDHLLTPMGGIGDITQGECAGNLCKRFSSKLHKIYWREPGVDEF